MFPRFEPPRPGPGNNCVSVPPLIPLARRRCRAPRHRRHSRGVVIVGNPISPINPAPPTLVHPSASSSLRLYHSLGFTALISPHPGPGNNRGRGKLLPFAGISPPAPQSGCASSLHLLAALARLPPVFHPFSGFSDLVMGSRTHTRGFFLRPVARIGRDLPDFDSGRGPHPRILGALRVVISLYSGR